MSETGEAPKRNPKIVALFEGATEAAAPGDGPGGPESSRLPEGCPIVPLGMQGSVYYFLDERGQLRDVLDKDLTFRKIESLVGRNWRGLEDWWPKKDKHGHTTGWDTGWASRQLKGICAEIGIWSPQERVRGAGCWLGLDGELIMHLGDEVAIYPTAGAGRPVIHAPGQIGAYVYPGRSALPQPAAEAEPPNAVAEEILRDLRTWNWSRPDIDPYLYLGQAVAGVLGGALKWRPMIWTPGGSDRGKSTLKSYTAGMLGSWQITSADASEAGVTSKLKYDTRPVLIDEAEAEEDNRRMAALIALARRAASGDIKLRGSANHEVHEFMMRSCLSFSSILRPPLNNADLSRMAILELRALTPGTQPPAMTPRRLELLGRRLLRRIVDQWPRFGQTLEAYRHAMAQCGHSGRGADVFGTLLACQDIARFDEPPDGDTLLDWQVKLARRGLAELSETLDIERTCLLHLLTQRLEAYRGGTTRTVGEWVRQANQSDALGQRSSDAIIANDILKGYGLEVRPAPLDKATGQPKWPGIYLWIANRHASLSALYRGSKWQSASDTAGGWVQHLKWLPGSQANVSYWCGGMTKATLIPLALCVGEPLADDEGDVDPSPAGRSPAPGAGGADDGLGAIDRSAGDTAHAAPPRPDPSDPGPSPF